MFGQNPILKKDHSSGAALHIVKGSPFRTIQGEGPYAGWPAVFLRLHGCNLACTFCDTNFSDPDDPVVEIEALHNQIEALFGPEQKKLVVITGGEPLRQNIRFLCGLLSFIPNLTIQIETAGTLWVDDIEMFSKIIVSPKTSTLHPMAYENAIAFKYVIDVKQTFDGFIPITATQANTRARALAAPRPGAPVYLSPMDMYDEARNRANCSLVADLAMRYGCIAGLQLHKFMDLP